MLAAKASKPRSPPCPRLRWAARVCGHELLHRPTIRPRGSPPVARASRRPAGQNQAGRRWRQPGPRFDTDEFSRINLEVMPSVALLRRTEVYARVKVHAQPRPGARSPRRPGIDVPFTVTNLRRPVYQAGLPSTCPGSAPPPSRHRPRPWALPRRSWSRARPCAAPGC